MKLCDLIYVLKDASVNVDFFCYEKKLIHLFSGTMNDFKKSIHYYAFQTERILNFDLVGTWFEGYTANVTCAVAKAE